MSTAVSSLFRTIIEAENMDYKNVKEIKLVNPYVNYFPDIVEFARLARPRTSEC